MPEAGFVVVETQAVPLDVVLAGRTSAFEVSEVRPQITGIIRQRLFDEGWLLAPGSLFHATPRPSTLMRINFASTQDERFWLAVARERARTISSQRARG